MQTCEHTQRIEQLEAKYRALAEQMAEQIADTKQVKDNTLQIIDVMQSWEGAMRVLEGIGRFFRPLGYIALGISALMGMIVAIKSGITPK